MNEKKTNVKEFELPYCSITEVDSILEGKEIDLRSTIERMRGIGFIDDDYLTIVDHNDEWAQEENIELYSDEFYEKLEEFKNEGKSIFIHAVYATECIGGGNLYQYEIDDEDFATVGINSWAGNYDLRLSRDFYTGDDVSSYGITIKDNKIGLALYCRGIYPIVNLDEPLDQFAIKLMLDTIVFKE